MIQIEPVPAFRDNYIWVIRNNQHAVAVDPGDARALEDHLAHSGLKLAAILSTHHHADHVGGNLALAEKWGCPVHGPATESIPALTHPLSGGERVAIAALGVEFEVIALPGHTLGHIAFYSPGALFCGDTLFGCGCGRVFEGTMAQMHASLSRLAGLPQDTRVYCAHEYTLANIDFALEVEPGNSDLVARYREDETRRRDGIPTLPSTIALELATNPFLRCESPEVIRSVARHAGKRCGNAAEVFALLRTWRNGF